jgi:hypothetical protein
MLLDNLTIPVKVNGKIKSQITFHSQADKDDIMNLLTVDVSSSNYVDIDKIKEVKYNTKESIDIITQ